MLKYVLFDLDGTLNDSGEGIRTSVAYALKKFGIEGESKESLNRLIGPPLVNAFMEFYGFDKQKATQARLYYREFYEDKGMYMCSMYSGIDALLDDLKKVGLKLVVCTSKPTEPSVKILKYLGIYDYFDGVFGATIDGSLTEKEQIIALAVKELNLDANSAVMVGDRKFDAIGARQNNIKSIGVTYGFGSKEELAKAGYDFIADDLSQLKDLILKM